jgi:tetratricopeptide (TPR) repeat protein
MFNLAVSYEYDFKGIRGGADGTDYDKALEIYKDILKKDKEYINAAFNAGIIYSKKKNNAEAIKLTKEALKFAVDFAAGYYNLACYYALDGDKDNALKNLEKSVELGYRDFDKIEADSDLKSITGEKEFKDIVVKYKKKKNI